MARDRRRAASEKPAGARAVRRERDQAQFHHGALRLDQRARERAAHDAALRRDPDGGNRLARPELCRLQERRGRSAHRRHRDGAGPRSPRGAVAPPPGALRRGAAGAAALFPRRCLCAAEMAEGRDAHRPPIPDDAVDRAMARRRAGAGVVTRFILTRLLQVLAVLAVMSFVIYALIGLMPGDPIDQMLTADPHLTAADAARLKALYGLDRPLAERYLAWARAALAGDFGYSRLYATPAVAALMPRLGNTALLMLSSFLLALAIALPPGAAAAQPPGPALDGAANLLSFPGLSIPPFWFALVLILVFAVALGWLPAGGGPPLRRGGRIHPPPPPAPPACPLPVPRIRTV